MALGSGPGCFRGAGRGAFAGDGILFAVPAVDSGSSGSAFAVTKGLPGDARFEIGWITKTMTAALLGSLGGDGVLALDDDLLLSGAVRAAVKGSDPRRVRPRAPGEMAGPEWDERAGALARTLLDGDYAGARQMVHPQLQSTLMAERLGQEWQLALDQIGDPGPVTVSCRSQLGGVAALITFR
jgi:hypothetical protein